MLPSHLPNMLHWNFSFEPQCVTPPRALVVEESCVKAMKTRTLELFLAEIEKSAKTKLLESYDFGCHINKKI